MLTLALISKQYRDWQGFCCIETMLSMATMGVVNSAANSGNGNIGGGSDDDGDQQGNTLHDSCDPVAQFVVANEIDNFARALGLRAVGSALNRVIGLQEAEAGGADLGVLHVNVDSSARIEFYSEAGTTERYFLPIGWWVLTP